MISTDDTRIHGLVSRYADDGVEVSYVYPGSLEVRITTGVTMPAKVRPQQVVLGMLLADPDHQDPRDDRGWRWSAGTNPVTRRWAQHVLAADTRSESLVYEHDGEVVLVWSSIPARAHELALLEAGFTPALATWRAPATPETRALAMQMVKHRSSPPAFALGTAPPVSPEADERAHAERVEHAWMRWAACMDTRVLIVGPRTYDFRGPPQRDGSTLVLRYRTRGEDLQIALDVERHPLIYDVSVGVGGRGTSLTPHIFPGVAWEDFPALVGEIERLVADKPAKAAKPTAAASPTRGASPGSAYQDARSALKDLALPPKRYAYFVRRADEAIDAGKAWAPIVARARRSAEKLGGTARPAQKPPARQPREQAPARPSAVDTALDSFNREPRWRATRLRTRADGYTLAVHPEGRDADAAVASVDVIHGDIDEIRWLDDRLTAQDRERITERLDRALIDAQDDEGEEDDDDDAQPRPSPLQDLIDLMDRRSVALGARPTNTAKLERGDGYRHIAEALRDLARPSGPGVDELQRWLESEDLMSAGEVVGRARGDEPVTPRQLMRDLWSAVFAVLTLEYVSGRPGALVVPDEALFSEDDSDFVLERVRQGEHYVVRRVRVRAIERDEETGSTTIEDPTDRLAPAAPVHNVERPASFYAELYGKLGAFHDDLERAPRTLQDVRTLLYWSAVMLDAPLCQGEVKARAAATFTQAKAYHDTARRKLLEGRSVDAVRRLHEAMRRISSAAAEIARSCAEGQIDLGITPPRLPVRPDDQATIEGRD